MTGNCSDGDGVPLMGLAQAVTLILCMRECVHVRLFYECFSTGSRMRMS